MDFSVKEINMGVENIANGNSIIRELNLFFPEMSLSNITLVDNAIIIINNFDIVHP